MTGPNLNTITEAIYARFQSNWADDNYVFDDNENYTPPKDTPWARLTIRNRIGKQHTLGAVGNRQYERSGAILGQIFVPANKGRKQSDSLAQTFKDIFEGTSFNGVDCYDGSIREVGVDGLWYQVVVEINFTYNELK